MYSLADVFLYFFQNLQRFFSKIAHTVTEKYTFVPINSSIIFSLKFSNSGIREI